MSNAPAAPVTENGVPPTTHGDQEVSSFKVFAGNLAYTTTDDGLKAFFEPVQSDILSAQVIMRGTRSAGYGFVALASSQAAQQAVELLDKKELDGRQVIIEIAKPADQKVNENKERKAKRRPGRRGGKAVPGEISEAEADVAGDAKVEPAAAASTDDAPKLRKKRKSGRKNKAKPEIAETSADAAEESEAAKKPPRVRKPRVPRPSRPAGEDPIGEPSKSMLFVANLGFNVDDEDLSALFTEAGITVVSARVVRRRWGQPRKSKGYGFVDVGGEAEQAKAIQLLEGKDVGGRNIAVKIAVNTPHGDGVEADNAADATAP